MNNAIITIKISHFKIKKNVPQLLKINILKNIYKKIGMQVRKLFYHIKTNQLQGLKIFNFKSSPRSQKVFIVVDMRRMKFLGQFKKLLRIKCLIRYRS